MTRHASLDSRAEEHRHAAADRFDPRDVGSRDRASHELHVDGRHHGRAVFRRDAVRPEGSGESRERSLRAVEGARRADSLRGVGRGRRVRSRRAAEAAPASAPISKAIRRRACRSSTSPPARSARASAPRSASRSTPAGSRRTTAPTCCSATANRPKDPCGKRPNVGAMDRLDNLCGITDVNGLGQSRADDVGARHGAVRAPLARVRLARDRHRRPRHRRRSSTRSTKRAAPRASRR